MLHGLKIFLIGFRLDYDFRDATLIAEEYIAAKKRYEVLRSRLKELFARGLMTDKSDSFAHGQSDD